MSNIISLSKTIAEDARNTILELKNEREELVLRRDAFLKEKDDLFLQPLCKQDIKQFIFDYIDRQSAAFLEEGGMDAIVKLIAFPQRPQVNQSHNARNTAINLYELDSGFKADGCLETYIFGFGNIPIFNGHRLSHGGKRDLCFYFGDLIKEKIAAHFDNCFPSGWDTYKPGLPVVERRKKIAEIDAEIAELDLAIKEYDTYLRHLSFSAKV